MIGMTCQEETTIVATVRNGQEAIKVVLDEIEDSPREWSNLGVISMCDGREVDGLGEETYHLYGCEDNFDRPDNCGKELFKDTLTHMPLFVDDWGWKRVIRTAPNRANEVPDGYIYATEEQAVAMGCISKRTGRPSAAAAKRMLRDEIAAYNQYLAGEVYAASLVRTDRCDHGVDHEVVLEDVHGFYPPYDGNIDGDGRCLYRLRQGWPDELHNPADDVVRMFIRDFIDSADDDGNAEALGWYRAAAKCEDLSDEARAFWAEEARALEAGMASAASVSAKARGKKSVGGRA